ncbi:MAG: flagellar biosynthetic protein FliO [Gammaproteobacteria bacterium]|nr:MAG: flagellar biosynthetic protein FliO [Gammaproteobacteria bacterium]
MRSSGFASPTSSALRSASRNCAMDSTSVILQIGLSLLLVVAAIWGSVWLMRRLNGMTGQSSRALRIQAVLPVGQRERVMVIRAGEESLLIGVTPQSIVLLKSLGNDFEATSEAVSAPADSEFARKLQSLLVRDKKLTGSNDTPPEPKHTFD